MNATRTCIALFLLLASLSMLGQDKTQPPATDDSAAFSVTDANVVLAQLREALEGHSERKFFAAFDGSRMKGFTSFQDQVESFFANNDGIRVNVRINQSSVENGRGIDIASIQMEMTPRNGNTVRHETQMRFELERSNHGWRIVDLTPRSFFS